MSVVLDSWAIVRFLEDDGRAAQEVADLLHSTRPVVSWINLGEVFYILRRITDDESATSTIRDLRDVLIAETPDESRILAAARIKARHPMAYADAFAAATAVAHDATLWTGDPELMFADASWRWYDLR